jgi:hypothetical protein
VISDRAIAELLQIGVARGVVLGPVLEGRLREQLLGAIASLGCAHARVGARTRWEMPEREHRLGPLHAVEDIALGRAAGRELPHRLLDDLVVARHRPDMSLGAQLLPEAPVSLVVDPPALVRLHGPEVLRPRPHLVGVARIGLWQAHVDDELLTLLDALGERRARHEVAVRLPLLESLRRPVGCVASWVWNSSNNRRPSIATSRPVLRYWAHADAWASKHLTSK